MRKRILSVVLVLAMLTSILPVPGVSAESAEAKHTHSDAHVCGAQCAGGTVEWKQWGVPDAPKTSLPTESGHYYLGADVALGATVDVPAGTDITICLNGYNIRSKSNARIGYVYGKLTISDCTACQQDGQYISGSVVGGTAADGAVYNVRRGGTLVLESGKITGGKTTGDAAGGAVYLQKGTTAGPGGVMYMYGGEITGNEGNHGGAICLGGADSGCVYAALYMYGGTITGNTARGDGGGIYAQNRSILELHGGVITDNTAANNGQAVNIVGQWTKVSASGTVQLDGMHFVSASNAGLKVNGLTEGTRIIMTTAATELEKIISLASGGKQESWSAHWVTANGESVSMVDGGFVLGHYHGDVKYEPWIGSDNHNTLPNSSKNYYLANDIVRNTGGGTITIGTSTTQHLCLNGFTITHRNPANRLYDIKGTFYLEDCTAYTDAQGNYISGGITYDGATASTRTYGNCFSVLRGGTMTMTAGQIYGFRSELKASDDSVPVYVQGAQTTGKAVFNMTGGQIHSNTTKANGAAIRMTKASSNAATENFSEINISGGKIWGNTTTANGGAIATTGDILNITGGIITGNTAALGAVYAASQTQLSVSGNVTVTDNRGGNLYLADDQIMKLGTMTGGKIGLCAAKVGRAVSTEQTADPSAYFESDNSECKLRFENNCLYLGSAHEHGIDGKAGQMGWSKWTSADSLPDAAGNYYLENDVQLSGTFTLRADVNLCLNGKTVTAADGKRILAVGKGATFAITDCCQACGTITGGTNDYGAAFNVLRGGTLKLYNGKLTGNTSGDEGGAVYIQGSNDTTPGGKFYMYGGEISGNSAKRGGAVALTEGSDPETAGSFFLYGGTITGNTAANGAGIYIYQGAAVTLGGGEIIGNTATAAGGGVYANANISKLVVEGTPVVKNNKAGMQNNNIHLLGETVMVDAGVRKGAELFVTAEKSDRIISSAVVSEEAGECFFSDSAYREVVKHNAYIYCNTTGEHVHCDCVTMTTGCQHLQVKWQAWESVNSLPTASGHYYLLNDVALTERLKVAADADIHICLNGKTVTAPEKSRLVLIQTGGKLSVTDCGTTGKLTGGSNTYGGAVNVSQGAVFNLYGGSITGNQAKPTSSEGRGGAVYLQAGSAAKNGGIFNMYGGKISGNAAYQGGGIYVAAPTATGDILPAVVNIYGGEISGNRAGYEAKEADGRTKTYGGNGAAIYAGKNSSLTMQGGTVCGNAGLSYGGTVYLNGAAAQFAGGRIVNNTSAKDGGGLYAAGGAQVELCGSILISGNHVSGGAGGGFGASGKSRILMSGGTVSNNYAAQGGGAIIQSGATMTMTGGSFEKNEAKTHAGAVYVNTPNADGTVSSLYLKDGTITQNKSGNAAGGIYCNSGYVEMTGGTISKNETKNYGCGIFFIKATGKVTGGTITQNVSGKDGTGIYGYAGEVEIGGDVKITNNTSQKGAGGGLGFTRECKAKLTGGTISGNTAGNAGGIIVQGKAHLTMTGGTVANNTTRASGGGVYVNKSSMDFLGGTISGNKSAKSGAGLFANESTTRFSGTAFTNNEATTNGGAMYINKGKAVFTGGTYSRNSSQRYGGGLYLNAAEVTMQDARIMENTAKSGSGGIHGFGGTLTIKDTLFSGNQTDVAGGGICVTKFCRLTMSDCVLEKNEANNAGAVLVQNWAEATLNDLTIRENQAYEGPGLYVFSNVEVTVNGGTICNNLAITKLNKSGQPTGGLGAGVYVHTNTKTRSGNSTLYLNDTQITDNIAQSKGGGIFIDKQMSVYLDGCTVKNNQANGEGAGIYQNSGTQLYAKNSKIMANTGTATGSAIYAGSDLELDGCVITGNKTTDGTAVYVAPARYDGHSYTNAVIKLGGDLQICDNEGTMQGDLYFDEGVAAAGTAGGFGKNTEIRIQLHSGVLTNAILAAYHYEGGDQLYTITYGDRSLTDPEYEGTADLDLPGEEPVRNIVLYAGVGVFALAITAAVVLLLLKKKKTAASAEKK